MKRVINVSRVVMIITILVTIGFVIDSVIKSEAELGDFYAWHSDSCKNLCGGKFSKLAADSELICSCENGTSYAVCFDKTDGTACLCDHEKYCQYGIISILKGNRDRFVCSTEPERIRGFV